MLDLTQPFFSNMLNLVPSAPVKPATSVSLGDLQSGAIGSIVPRPTMTANGTYTTQRWSSSDLTVLDIASQPDGIKLVGAGKATITVTLLDDAGKTLATVSKEYTVTVPAAPPVFSAQPAANVFYQEGGKLEITGAAASPVTSWQWQKLADNGTDWADVQQATPGPVLTIAAGTAADEGTYRVLAINAGAPGVPSNTVKVANLFLYIQNDSKKPDLEQPSTDATNQQFVMVDHQHYLIDGPAGNYYIGSYLKTAHGYTTTNGGVVDIEVDGKLVRTTFAPGDKLPAEASIIPTDFGLTTARAMGATWTTSDEAVFSIAGANANGGFSPVAVHAGKATIVANYGNLSSTLTVDI